MAYVRSFLYDLFHESILTLMFPLCRYCTDDMLQREMMSNPFLGSYGVIILDDIHERSMATDVLLGLCVFLFWFDWNVKFVERNRGERKLRLNIGSRPRS